MVDFEVLLLSRLRAVGGGVPSMELILKERGGSRGRCSFFYAEIPTKGSTLSRQAISEYALSLDNSFPTRAPNQSFNNSSSQFVSATVPTLS